MILLSSIITAFETEFLAQYGHELLPGQRRALAAMGRCRTALSPRMLTQCDGCEESRLIPRSCGHRACPHCQHHESQLWLQRQIKKLVSSDYFLLTLTLPAELRHLAWPHQRILYDQIMQCSWATLRTFSLNDRQLQGTPGAIAVPYNHSRRLDYPPTLIWSCQRQPLIPKPGCGLLKKPAQSTLSFQPQGPGQGLSD